MTDNYVIWKPEYTGHKPPHWVDGMDCQYKDDLGFSFSSRSVWTSTANPTWHPDKTYRVPYEAVHGAREENDITEAVAEDKIKAAVQELLTEVRAEQGVVDHATLYSSAMYLAVERHEAFRREVSDAVARYFMPYDTPEVFRDFIIAAPEPDPLVDVLAELNLTADVYPSAIRKALEARGLEIRPITAAQGEA